MNIGKEEKFTEIWCAIFDLNKYEIVRNKSIFEMGADSIKISDLNYRIIEEFGVELPLDEVFEKPTFEGIFSILKSEYMVLINTNIDT